eukprot:TRINITY_DN27000_c0_g1_i1.p1 TRINITY_DN27000_c0_g1~~TRINITY_DN27000_c0_g1_i1.p1  ORF type:complete len:1002 (+),score=218.11 TRINITY_DN27000_c0_g1_i1:169-3006(+)
MAASCMAAPAPAAACADGCERLTSAAAAVKRWARRHPEDLGHLEWYVANMEAYREENLPQLGSCAYMDYAGAALYTSAQVDAASTLMRENLMVNPHTSREAEEGISLARERVLALFGVDSSTHSVIFTSGATDALRMVGERFPWRVGGMFAYSDESHTSVLGLREYALSAGAECSTYPLEHLHRLVDEGQSALSTLEGSAPPGSTALEADAPAPPRLLAVAGESNFSGVRARLSCLAKLRSEPKRWYVLLDAAKLASTPGALDLSRYPADFTAVSFYKIFGYPTGLGALIVRHDAASALSASSAGKRGSYFGGGGVAAVAATSSFVVPRANLSERLELGTPHYTGIAALPAQIDLSGVGSCYGRRHALAVCREAYLRTRALEHRYRGGLAPGSARPLCRIYGRHGEADWAETQGPTLALSLLFADGSPVPYGLVAQRAAAWQIVLRVGCVCNPGACQKYLDISSSDVRKQFAAGKVCGDDLGLFEGRPTGAVRLSFGRYSTLADVGRWVRMLEAEFLDRLPEDFEAEERKAETAEEATAKPTGNEASATPPPPPLSVHVPAAAQAVSGRLVGLKVYPIKGCGPLVVRRWPLDPRTGALLLDRRWCLQVAPASSSAQRSGSDVNLTAREADGGGRAASGGRSLRTSSGRAISAKQAPRLTQVRFRLRRSPSGLELLLSTVGVDNASSSSDPLRLPLPEEDVRCLLRAGIDLDEFREDPPSDTGAGSSDGRAHDADARAQATATARWFEELLDLPRLQLVDAAATPPAAGTGEAPAAGAALQHFANAPSTLLLVSMASLREFGRVCGLSAPADRFRANLEVDLEPPFAEATWSVGRPVSLGKLALESAGRCVRCQAVDVDPESGEASGPSLLHALATARPGGGKGPTFGVLLRQRAPLSPATLPPMAELPPSGVALDARGESALADEKPPGVQVLSVGDVLYSNDEP